MFLVWYFIFSFIYLIVLVLDIFFNRILKFNSKLFNLIFLKIGKLLDFFTFKNTNKSNLNINVSYINYKDLYSSYLFFSKYFNVSYLNLNSSFFNILIFFTLSKKFFNNFNFSFIIGNFLFFIFFKKLDKNRLVKKINLSNFANIIKIKGINYNNSIILFSNSNKNLFNNFKTLYVNDKFNLITISNNFKNSVVSLWNIKYAPSNFLKYVNLENISVYNILYLRKNKVFNKGRYSRNRQYYRTGVYWCLYVNIIAVIGIYFWFYRFTMNFGYLWWLLFLFIFSFVAPKTIKYRFYNVNILINSISNDILWLSSIVNSLISMFIKYLSFFYSYLNKSVFSLNFFGLNNNNLNFLKLLNINNRQNVFYIWEYNNTSYNSNGVFSFIEKFRYSLVQFFIFSFNK